MPAAIHDLVDGVRGQLGSVKSVALGDLHHHLGVVIQVVGLLSKGVHFPHQDSCTTKRANHRHRGERAESEGRVYDELQEQYGAEKGNDPRPKDSGPVLISGARVFSCVP